VLFDRFVAFNLALHFVCRHFKVGSCQDDMFCLRTWFGFQGLGLRSAKNYRLVPCYAKLASKFVGYLQVCQETFNLHNIKSVHQGLCDLQAQASKLMPHACRNFEDVILTLTFGQQSHQQDHLVCLTPSGFAYKDSLTQEEAEQACRVINTAERVDVAWDDNDEHAKRVLSQHNIEVTSDYERGYRQIVLRFGVGEPEQDLLLPREVTLADKNRVRWVDVASTRLDMQHIPLVDLRALEEFQIDTLRLLMVQPVSWHACHKVKSLSYICFVFSATFPSGVSQLKNLEFLFLGRVGALPSDFTCLNIKTLVLQICPMDLVKVALQLATMPTLKSLTIEMHNVKNTQIPTELGLVTSLEVLDLKNNHFCGSIPTELGQLSKLSKLCIQESSTSSLDLTWPQEVLDLGIPTLLSARRP